MTADVAFGYAYGSGRYDSRVADLETWLDQAFAASSLAAGTEVAGRDRVAALHNKGWSHHSGKSGHARELWCAWKRSEWALVAEEEHVLSDKAFFSSSGKKKPPNEALVTILRHRDTGFLLGHIVEHNPSSVEGHRGPGGIFGVLQRRVGVTLDVVTGTGRLKRDIKRRFDLDAVMAGGDWNLNHARRDVQAFFKAAYPRAKMNFTRFHGKGTLGKRFIDVFFLWGLEVLTNPRVKESIASDHRWYHQLLGFTGSVVTAPPPPLGTHTCPVCGLEHLPPA